MCSFEIKKKKMVAQTVGYESKSRIKSFEKLRNFLWIGWMLSFTSFTSTNEMLLCQANANAAVIALKTIIKLQIILLSNAEHWF